MRPRSVFFAVIDQFLVSLDRCFETFVLDASRSDHVNGATGFFLDEL